MFEKSVLNSTGNPSGPGVLPFCILSITSTTSSAEKGNSSSFLIAFVIVGMGNGSKKLSIRDLSVGGSDLYNRVVIFKVFSNTNRVSDQMAIGGPNLRN